MAAVQGLRGDERDGFHRARHAVPDGMVVVKAAHELVIDDVVRVVVAHADLLADDALLLRHGLVGEVRRTHEAQQHAQVVVELVGGLEVVAGEPAGGVGVGLGAVGGQGGKSVVAVRHVEHLVL